MDLTMNDFKKNHAYQDVYSPFDETQLSNLDQSYRAFLLQFLITLNLCQWLLISNKLIQSNPNLLISTPPPSLNTVTKPSPDSYVTSLSQSVSQLTFIEPILPELGGHALIQQQVESMEALIPLVNKLQNILSSIQNSPLDLPQIAVVGSQSCGKSSCLEQIVGKDFLPKGTGIITRRPLVLQLHNLPFDPSKEEEPKEYGVFQHLGDQCFYDFDKIKHEIIDETIRVSGDNKGISKEPIYLKIFSPHVLNLTLVDLPGLTKIPVGDQPTDIELQTRSLVLEYISKPNCIILAVSPANIDLANSDALKLAREVDPQGLRTLGLLTKVDLMDNGTNALDILLGKVYPLKLGFIAVVNRSQQDVSLKRPLNYAREVEAKFFSTHPVYASFAHQCGVRYLSRTLNSILMHHIKMKLPDLKARLSYLISIKQTELMKYGDPLSFSSESQHSTVLRLLTQYARDFNASVDGTLTYSNMHELTGGARIYHIFDQIFGQTLEALDPATALSSEDIRMAIRNSTGTRPSLFIPEAAFDILVKPQIAQLEAPSLRCVEHVYEALLRMTHECVGTELQRYPKLKERVIEGVTSLLKEHLGPTCQFIEQLVGIQCAYINTNHPDFIGGNNAIAKLEKKQELEKRKRESVMMRRKVLGSGTPLSSPTVSNSSSSIHSLGSGTGSTEVVEWYPSYMMVSGSSVGPHSEAGVLKQEDPSTRETFMIDLIRILLGSYFAIVKKSLMDTVPKSIMHFLVNQTKWALQNRLVQALYKDELITHLLEEDPSIVAQRQQCLALLEVYRQALDMITQVLA